ncbi:MscS family inner membrane protein YnaI [Chlamydia abortus]|nr:MscS family inner membrane protein YnaI [Chlamydia abortus]
MLSNILVQEALTENTNAIHHFYSQLVETFMSPETWNQILIGLIKILLILLLGKIVKAVTRRLVDRLVREREKNPLRFSQRRAKTLGKLVGNVVNYTVNFILILMILSQLGLHLGPLLAGAGVVGLAIGFGAQSLVKDVITGFFIIFEDQFAVGDTVQIGSYKGTVEEIGLRVTRIASWTGEVYIIPNGLITQVTNYSMRNSLSVVDIVLSYHSDVDKAIFYLKEAFAEMADNQLLVARPEVLGMQTMGMSDLTLRIVAECKPNQEEQVKREILAQVKKTLDQHKIEIAMPA